MDEKKIIGQRIRDRRKLLGWRLERLSKESDLNISSLSKIETGDESYNPSEEALERIAKALDTKLDHLRSNSNSFNVGIGACLWGAPLLNMIFEEKVNPKFSICYQVGDDNMPLWHDERVKPKKIKLCTAKEQVEMLNNRDMDMIFVPRGTYSHEAGNLFRICSIMNTVKGGLTILTLSNKKSSKGDIIASFRSKTKNTCLYYAKRTIAEQVIEEMTNFLYSEYKSRALDVESIEIHDIEKFKSNFIEHIEEGDINKFQYAYIGWEPHISILRSKLIDNGFSEDHITEIELFEIVSEKQPYDHIYFDCIVAADKVDLFKQSADLKEFFFNLDWSITALNSATGKGKLIPNAAVKDIANKLDMNEDRALKCLSQINFELTFSKEWELYKFKTA